MPEERIYTIPLRRAKETSRGRRTPKSVRLVIQFLKRHMKSDKISLDEQLNQKLWERGIKKPPSRIRVRAVKEDDGSVNAFLAE